MAWYLNRALTNFRAAVNVAYPRRDKASDGTIGDPDHQARTSDHNPDPAGEPDAGSVDAWDMDVELNGVGKPYAADVEHLKQVFQAHESSRYWIHNRTIASRDIDNWRRRPYDGDNPHTQHVHWNTRESHEDSNAPWEVDMALDQDDIDKIVNGVWAKQIVGGDNKTTYPASSYVRNTLIGVQIDLPQQIGALAAEKPVELDYDKLADALLRRVLTPPAEG